MILRAGSGWQTITADLALILFLITAQASRETPSAPQPSKPVEMPLAESSGAGLAIYRHGPETDLKQWLEATLTDDRQSATVSIRYPVGERDAAFRAGSRLLHEIERQGSNARLVLEVGPRAETESMVTIDYDGRSDAGTSLAEGG